VLANGYQGLEGTADSIIWEKCDPVLVNGYQGLEGIADSIIWAKCDPVLANGYQGLEGTAASIIWAKSHVHFTLKRWEAGSSIHLVPTYQTTGSQNPVDRKLDINRHINLEYQIAFEWFSSVTPDKCHDNIAH
jgi:hypothetical protein